MTRRRVGRFALLVVLVVVVLLLGRSRAAAQTPGGQIIPGKYIVLLVEGADPAAVAAKHGLARAHTYRAAVNGFAGHIPTHKLAALQADPRVRLVAPDRRYTLDAQILPSGVNRIEADKNPSLGGGSVDLDIAIFDTGIDRDHPDLNVQGGYNGTSTNRYDYDDFNGHGTHTAGIAAAIDNGVGAVGVAPGARLWAIRVCYDLIFGIAYCDESSMVAGLDMVVACKDVALGRGGVCEIKDRLTGENMSGGINFAAANMSITTPDQPQPCGRPDTTPVHDGICSLRIAGVPLSLSAGNDSGQRQAFPEAIAVSAIADKDGQGQGLAGSFGCGDGLGTHTDDTLASYSNSGPEIDLAAPGTCIYSTWLNGGYNTVSGTSMAAPHVAGAAALYLYANDLPPATDAAGVDAIRQALLADALPKGSACSYTTSRSDANEPLLFVNGPAFGGDGSVDPCVQSDGPPAVTITNLANGSTVSGTVTVTADASDDYGVTQVEFFVDGSRIDVDTAAPYEATWDTTAANDGNHTVTATAKDTVDQTTSDAVNVTVDNVDESPTVTITNPTGGSSVSGTVTVTADASDDNGVTQVEFLVDGGSIGVDATAPYTATWDTIAATNGAHTVTARVTDTFSQTADDTIGVTVDNVDALPTVTITNPSDGSTVSGTVTVTADASDDNGLTQVEFFVDGGSIGVDATAPYTATWDTTAATNGAHTVSARATDTFSQTADDTIGVTVDNVDALPTVTITNPTGGSSVSGTVTVTADASDDNGVNQVKFFVDGASIGVDATAPYTATWDTSTATDGVHALTATVTDMADQTSSETIDVIVDNLAEGMHVGDLDGFSASQGKTWEAMVEVTVHDASHGPVSGAIVSGSWDGGSLGGDSCTTGPDGTCTVSLGNLAKKTAAVSFTVASVQEPSSSYAPADNHDAEGDSDGTTISVAKDAIAPPPPPTGTRMHLALLQGDATPVGRNKWKAVVTVSVEDENQIPVANATVSGDWTNDYTASGSCTTGGDGRCTISSPNFNNSNGPASVSFTFSGIAHSALAYDPADNEVALLTVVITGPSQ